jgi:very-short-patch-repair endonuclease
MLQEFSKQYQRKMWRSMISRKKLNFNIWDVIKFNKETVYYMPYNNFQKFKVDVSNCNKCGEKLYIGFRKNEFITNTCKCSADSKSYATLQKLLSIFSKDTSLDILQKFADAKTRNLQNKIEYWLNQGYTDSEASQKVVEIQTSRSRKSLAAKKGARGYSVRTKEYWMKRGMTELEAIKKVSEVQVTNGLSVYVKKYGELIGTKKYNSRIDQWMKKMLLLTLGVSAVSTELFEAVDPIAVGAYGDHETTVRGKTKVYRVDYIDKKQKKIIEFDGTYWHADPAKYQPTDRIRNKLVADIWQADIKKTKDLELAGYQVLRISESSYADNRMQVITQCKDFLNAN